MPVRASTTVGGSCSSAGGRSCTVGACGKTSSITRRTAVVAGRLSITSSAGSVGVLTIAPPSTPKCDWSAGPVGSTQSATRVMSGRPLPATPVPTGRNDGSKATGKLAEERAARASRRVVSPIWSAAKSSWPSFSRCLKVIRPACTSWGSACPSASEVTVRAPSRSVVVTPRYTGRRSGPIGA